MSRNSSRPVRQYAADSGRLADVTIPTGATGSYARGVLDEVTADGGFGFSHDAFPALPPPDYHGRLVVALDSNVLIDVQRYGAELIDAEQFDVRRAMARSCSRSARSRICGCSSTSGSP